MGAWGISSADGVAERWPCSISLEVMKVRLPKWLSSPPANDEWGTFFPLDDLVNAWENFDRIDVLLALLLKLSALLARNGVKN